jgi:hypothetical protein
MGVTVDVYDSFSAEFKRLPALGASGDFEMRFALQCRHIDLAAQRCDGKWDWHLAIQIVGFALEDFVFLDVDDHVKVTSRTTSNSSLAIA